MTKLLNNKKMYLSSRERVKLVNIQIDGEKARAAQGKVGKNATIQIEAPEVIINGAIATSTLSCWNLFEQTYSATTDKVKKLVIKNCNFDMLHISHNIASFYTFADNAEISFVNCTLTNLAPNVNPIRLDNLAGAKNVKVTFDNCTWSYDPAAPESAYVEDKQYLSLVLLQASGNAVNTNAYGSWYITVKDCKFGDEAITIDTFENYRSLTTIDQEGKVGDGKAVLYVYQNALYDCNEKAEYFPQVIIQNGSAKKIYKAKNTVNE